MRHIPEGTTHVDSDGNFWRIPSAEQADGTGEIWIYDLGWRRSEISEAFVARLKPVIEEHADGKEV